MLVDFFIFKSYKTRFYSHIHSIHLYLSRLKVTLLGFVLGLISNLFGVGSYFGLEPLSFR